MLYFKNRRKQIFKPLFRQHCFSIAKIKTSVEPLILAHFENKALKKVNLSERSRSRDF